MMEPATKRPAAWRAVWVRWILLTAAGYLLGVAAAWPVEMAARAVWPWPFPYFNALQHGPTAVGAVVCGGVLGWTQARAFRLLARGPSPKGWAIATALGWLTPLHVLAALAQWAVLRRYVRFGGWWVGAGWLTSAGLIANQWLLSDAWDLPAGPWGSLLYVLPISLWEGAVFGLMLAVLSRFPEQPTPTRADVATALPEPAA